MQDRLRDWKNGFGIGIPIFVLVRPVILSDADSSRTREPRTRGRPLPSWTISSDSVCSPASSQDSSGPYMDECLTDWNQSVVSIGLFLHHFMLNRDCVYSLLYNTEN
jgi:hypothetical protein